MARTFTARATRDPNRFPTADHELAEWEVESLYGRYIKAAVDQMARDIDPLADMAESAAQILRQRDATRKRSHEPRDLPAKPRRGSIASLPAETRTLVARLYAELGGNIAAVAHALDEQGVLPVRGGPWRHASIVRVLEYETALEAAAEGTA